MPDQASGIPTSSFDARPHVVTQTSEPDPFDGGCPADTENASAFNLRDEVNRLTHNCITLSTDNARLTELNANLKTAIREADASIKRMLGEIDAMVAKLMEAGK